MSFTKLMAAAGVAGAVVLCSSAVPVAQSPIPLKEAHAIKCQFSLIATGTWAKDGTPSAEVQPSNLALEYDEIDVSDGTAQVKGLSGKLYIIVRYAGVNLHLLAVDGAGPLYITTVFDKPAHPGKFKAAPARHEFTDISLPGFTSRPEQYYGECEVTK